jgi:pheromone a factor receptor
MAHSQLNRGRYLRLMALSATEIIGTIPLGTYFIVNNAMSGVTPWRGWAYTHSHYSHVFEVPNSVWKTNSLSSGGLETYRWSLVACAFVFFAFFGFADEARQHYRRFYTSIASRIGYTSFTLHGSSDA